MSDVAPVHPKQPKHFPTSTQQSIQSERAYQSGMGNWWPTSCMSPPPPASTALSSYQTVNMRHGTTSQISATLLIFLEGKSSANIPNLAERKRESSTSSYLAGVLSRKGNITRISSFPPPHKKRVPTRDSRGISS